MSDDVQAEAERIVDDFYAAVIAGAFDERFAKRLVAALAAAIEETDAEVEVAALRGNARQHGKGHATMRLGNAQRARRDALSALRQTDGEDRDG